MRVAGRRRKATGARPDPAGKRKREKVIGVLGGMGPEATLSFYEKLIADTPAARDQDHLRVVIDSNPKVPDRSEAILRHGGSPVPAMLRGVHALARAGADFVAIPCVSAHFFVNELRRLSPLPLLSMLDVLAQGIRERHPEIRTVGLLATTGTIEGRFLQRRLARSGITAIVPPDDDQQRVMSAIYAIKGSAAGRAPIARALRRVAERLVAEGAQAIVLGCTEIPLVLQPGDLRVPVFDTVRLLARAAILAAGRKPTRDPQSRPQRPKR